MNAGKLITPNTYPSRKVVVIRYDTSLVTSNCALIDPVAAVGADDANVLERIVRSGNSSSKENLHIDSHDDANGSDDPFP